MSATGWGVKVKVYASVDGRQSHKLLNPKNGPLAFAGKVDRGGNVEQLGDERAGDEEKELREKAIEFSREWPGKTGAKPLTAGQKLELQVGLWGVGADSLSLRPVRQFCLVEDDGRARGSPSPSSCRRHPLRPKSSQPGDRASAAHSGSGWLPMPGGSTFRGSPKSFGTSRGSGHGDSDDAAGLVGRGAVPGGLGAIGARGRSAVARRPQAAAVATAAADAG